MRTHIYALQALGFCPPRILRRELAYYSVYICPYMPPPELCTKPKFSVFDTDGDGLMFRSEFNKLVTVEGLDIDGDVVISATNRGATNYGLKENPKVAWPAPAPAPAPARLAEPPTFFAVSPTKTIKSMNTNGGSLSTSTQGAPAVTSVDALPPGWKVSKDTNGNAYYYNKELNVTQWSRPAPSGHTVASPQPPVPLAPTQAAPTATSMDALPPGWKASKDTNGNAYYYNTEMNVTQWSRPALPPGWKASKDTNGNAYYYNKELNVTQWRYPAPSVATV